MSEVHGPCVHCGAAPVSHPVLWLDALITLSVSAAVRNTLGRLISPIVLERSPLAMHIFDTAMRIFAAVGIIRYQKDLTGASERTRSIWTEALRRGIAIEQVSVLGISKEYLRAFLPIAPNSPTYAWQYFESIPIPRWVESGDTAHIDDKTSFKRLFRDSGLPIAEGTCVWTMRGALQQLGLLGTPIIVKPRIGSRARHTTVRINSDDELRRAFLLARQISPAVMIERYIPGSLFRVTCVGGRIVGAIEFIRPSIVADGSMTVRELRIAHNAHKRFPNLTDVKDDSWFRDAIAHQGYRLDDIPPAGTSVLLSEHSERPNGGYFIDITDELPSAHRAIIERAASVTRMPVIGFDIISEDLRDASVPFTFIEGNTLPYIEIHAIPYEGTPRNVAADVWNLWSDPR